jgi:hypothetical protein
MTSRLNHTMKSNEASPALKHGAYSATDVLPGESREAFEELHRGLIDEFNPSGAFEEHIVREIARLIWRKENLSTLHIAQLVQRRWAAVMIPHVPLHQPTEEETEQAKKETRNKQTRLRKELDNDYELLEIGNVATFDSLTNELEIKERLDSQIARLLKQLLVVRWLKSISAAPPQRRIPGPPSTPDNTRH